MKLNLGCGPYLLDGFVNLDAASGWRFEYGLDYPDGTVDAITVSHALHLVPLGFWPFVFSEMARVLTSGGIVRVTDDATDDPASERFGGYPGNGRDLPAVTLTSRALVHEHLAGAGLELIDVSAGASAFRDGSLIQRFHGDAPKVFFVEGRKP